ncbi:uncharacterized protein LOC111710843 isoform X2 [Eurytemora carolleeae]|nr:uncharacterized protein LOC111710843 isoform X2 [Eurytemora carolleeae]|eukprot:XP_023340780.1 uncharacterized protein LOC111710843 isoform X2 [Eurytemora affinis]
MCSTTVGYTNFGLYLPLHLNSVFQFNSQQGSLFLSIFSIGDFFGRVFGPALSDKFGTRWLWYCGGLSGAGLTMIILAFQVPPTVVGCCTFTAGICSGVFIGIYPALLSDELGADRLNHTYPVSLTIAGICNLAGPPILAQISSRLNSYAVMMVLGLSLIFGSLPLLLISTWRLNPEHLTSAQPNQEDILENKS